MKRKPNELQQQIRRALAETPAPGFKPDDGSATSRVGDVDEYLHGGPRGAEDVDLHLKLHREFEDDPASPFYPGTVHLRVPIDSIPGGHCGKPWCTQTVHHYSPDQPQPKEP